MTETFRLHDEVKEWVFDPSVVGTAFDLTRAHMATLALLNATGSGKVVRVRQVKAEILQAQTTTTGVPTNFGITRITAHTPGDEVRTAVKVDSSSDDLPSQVVLARRPPAVTTTGSVMETVPVIPLANVTRQLGGFCSRSMHSNLLDSVWRWDDGSGDTQKITLREGEGIALDPAGVHNAYPHWLEAGINVRVAATGACYRYKFPCYTSPLAMFSLLNGSGSGVVLEVYRVTLREIGTDEAPQVTLERIDAINEDTGYACDDVDAFDSSNSLPASIVCRGNVAVQLAGTKFGATAGNPHFFAKNGSQLGVGPGLAGIMPQSQGFLSGSQPFGGRAPHEPLYDMVLREGEGCALFQRTASGLAYFDHMIQLTVEDADAAAVYPAVGDVDSGVTFGPTGADYTGTLEQPAEADVRNGTGYGAGGVEFSGTLAGGGNTYSRSRVVNA